MPRPDAAETQADAASAKKKKKDKKKAEKPLFSALDPFTVNLRDERGERFAQIGITLEIEEPAIDAKIKDHLPTLRNNILLLIASKRIEEILTDDGKRQLATQIQGRIGEALGADKDDNPIKGVLFSQFLVQ